MLSANSSAFEDNPDKSLIYIKNNNEPIIEASKTFVLTSDQSETCPFNKTDLSFSESHLKDLVHYQIYHFVFTEKTRASCQTLSNTFTISRKTSLTSKPL